MGRLQPEQQDEPQPADSCSEATGPTLEQTLPAKGVALGQMASVDERYPRKTEPRLERVTAAVPEAAHMQACIDSSVRETDRA